jgi:DNA polymerase-3 subunit gamma/tau
VPDATTHEARCLTHRPRRFADLLGQDHVTVTLRNAVRLGRVHHAYLTCGPRGAGKTSAARTLAAAVKCQGPEGEPCGSCSCCRRVAGDCVLDLVEIDAASNRRIDESRSLRGNANHAPSAGTRKVYRFT